MKARLLPVAALHKGPLSDRMIIALSVERQLIAPLNRVHLSGASYDVSAGEIVTSRNRLRKVRIVSEPYVVESGECITLESLETFDLLASLCEAVLVNKHTHLARGIFHPATSIDPGFRGRLALTFFNLGRERFEIRYGMPIAKVLFLPVMEIPERLYGATQQPTHRQGSTDIALIVERLDTVDRDDELRKMYGRPIEYLYERLQALESAAELNSLRTQAEIRRRRRRIMWEVTLALFSGMGGALLLEHFEDIVDLLPPIP